MGFRSHPRTREDYWLWYCTQPDSAQFMMCFTT